MKIAQARLPQWANEAHTVINLMVKFEELGDEEMPFSASQSDVEEHGIELFQNAIQGIYGAIAAYEAPPVQPVPVPTEITTLQFLIAAALNGIITQAEALGVAENGEVPAAIGAVFGQLESDEQFVARVTWAKMTSILRSDSLVDAVGAAFSMTSEQLDQFFIAAAKL